MTEVITVGEKGQVVIPKKFRDNLKIVKGTKILIKEKKGELTIIPINLDENYAWMLLSEESLKKVWDNPFDKRWDDVF